MGRRALGGDAPGIADVAPAVPRRIAVEDLVVHPRRRHADPVAVPGDRSEVAADDEEVVRVDTAAEEGQDAVGPVVAVDPLKSQAVEVELME